MYQLNKKYPERTVLSGESWSAICQFMKTITLDRVLRSFSRNNVTADHGARGNRTEGPAGN